MRVPPRSRPFATVGLPRIALSVGGCLLVASALASWSLAAVRSPFLLARAPSFHPSRVAGTGIEPALAELPVPVPFELGRGDTLAGLLARAGVSAAPAHEAIERMRGYVDPRRVRPGLVMLSRVAADGSVVGIDVDLPAEGRLSLTSVQQGGSAWAVSWRPFAKALLSEQRDIVVDDSLEGALRAAGAPVLLAVQMAQVLQWDVDFNRDLRRGDRFSVRYEVEELDGSFHRITGISALRFDGGRRTLEAYRFEGHYYDGEGRPLRKMFRRSPLDFSRVTSRFSGRRFHPILKRYRPHYGVDYGAPTGTPVKATASGVITSAGWDGGGGRTVKIRHPNGYLTAYLHLSRYAKGIGAGRRVEQGEVIGYVGSSGLATAPHLDYRVQKSGRWIDPLSLSPQDVPPIAADVLPAFLVERDQLRAALEEPRPPPPTTAPTHRTDA